MESSLSDRPNSAIPYFIMIKVSKNLFVGELRDCSSTHGSFFVVHACKDPCHRNAVGYTRRLNPSHPNYLIKESNTDLFLNIVDMPQLSMEFAQPIFSRAMDFISSNILKCPVLIHCNLGESRAPSIALIYMAKHGLLKNIENYDSAAEEFSLLYPKYAPGRGVLLLLRDNWKTFIDI